MPCYLHRVSGPSQADYELWQRIGFTGTWADYQHAKSHTAGQVMHICGDLGDHCADCADFGDFLCDFPVGEGATCDRPMCPAHSTEIGPNTHYCATHRSMWEAYRAAGGVNTELARVVSFR
ncbi:hypothetical protein [Pseudorhodoferax sp. Leaf265]|uniref:hypothetical protein n=1 Tax=Pseudorhodoferax sp. Leaf265 TaxID=1736315 RepID=UPI0006FE551E|nr:hypothetical protein [Pseudorhodoferax sp. Leaf265]KQP02575.1 hypothetical protein ASF45_20875 [Pseudorhodoferax sp. Leaf265]